MVGPGDGQERGVDDPDAVLLQEGRHGPVDADELLDEVGQRGERAHRAPEPPEEHVHQQESRQPQHPHEGRAGVLMGGGGTGQQLVGDEPEHGSDRDLDHPGIPPAAHHGGGEPVLEQVTSQRFARKQPVLLVVRVSAGLVGPIRPGRVSWPRLQVLAHFLALPASRAAFLARLRTRSLRRIVPAARRTAADPPPNVPRTGASGRCAAAAVVSA
jgi:hypothetical protein